jgi:hypothetical protein
MSQLENKDL